MNQNQTDESKIEKMILEYDYRCMKTQETCEFASCLTAMLLPFVSPFISYAIASSISPENKDINASIAYASMPVSMIAPLAFNSLLYARRKRKAENTAKKIKKLHNNNLVEKVLNKHSTLESECRDYEEDCNFMKRVEAKRVEAQCYSKKYSTKASQYFLEITNKYLDSIIRRTKLYNPSDSAMNLVILTLEKNLNDFCNNYINDSFDYQDELFNLMIYLNKKYNEFIHINRKKSYNITDSTVKRFAEIIENYRPLPQSRWESTESKCH